MALPFRSGVKCKFSSLSACVSRRLCLIVNYFYSFALKTAAFRYVMKTPSSRPFLSPPFARSSDRFRARNVSYFIFALDRRVESPSTSTILLSSNGAFRSRAFHFLHLSTLVLLLFSFCLVSSSVSSSPLSSPTFDADVNQFSRATFTHSVYSSAVE